MKSGICLLLLATNHDPLARAAIPTAAKAGYDYAEVSLARIYSLSDNQLSDYRSLFLQSGLPVEVFNNAVPKGLALAGPGADPQALSRYIDRALYLAGFMGVSMITMSGPTRLTVPSDQTWMDIFPSYIQFLKEYTDRAAEYGVSLVIEPINEEEHSFISTVSTAMDAVMAVNRPNLMTMIDSYHFTKQKDDPDTVIRNISHIGHIHYAAQARRSYPLESDMDDCRQLLTPLFDAGYKGRISIEAYADNPEQDLPQSARLLGEILPK